jgi:hypothetical protein
MQYQRSQNLNGLAYRNRFNLETFLLDSLYAAKQHKSAPIP